SKMSGLRKQEITQAQHGVERRDPLEVRILRGVIGIATLSPGDKFCVTSHHARVIAPELRNTDRHRTIGIETIQDAIVAGMFLKKRDFVVIEFTRAVESWPRLKCEPKHFGGPEQNDAVKSSRFPIRKREQSSKKRAAPCRQTERNHAAMLRV